MSAWLVSQEHINAIISFAIDNGLALPGTPQKVCRLLTNENMRSLRARYPGRDFLDDWKQTAKTYRFRRISDIGEMLLRLMRRKQQRLGDTLPPMNETTVAVQIIKCCDCYDYQACETDQYYNSPAATFVEAVRRKAKAIAPGENKVLYEKLVWGLD